KSVGEVMAIGRVFKESFQKALRSLETGLTGLDEAVPEGIAPDALETYLEDSLSHPTPERIRCLADAMRLGWSDGRLAELTDIDPWFIAQIRQLVEEEAVIRETRLEDLAARNLRRWKAWGFSDARLARLIGCSEDALRQRRQDLGVRPVYKKVDTCAAEFEASTPYFYSTYEEYNEAQRSEGKKALILGSGPNRIGQGIEFDYCCVHASLALREAGWQSIMVNCNPETVSTDYDVSDRLYFEPITLEDVLEIVALEQPDGVVIQLGGQTPLKLAKRLEAAGVPVLGTPYDSIDRTEDRRRFAELVEKLGLNQPPNESATSLAEAYAAAARIGYPLMVRPSYVLGGRAMEIVYGEDELARYFRAAVLASPEHPVLIDKFLADAIEVDVDVLADGRRALVAGMMEHVEHAGVHSGDSACSLPPHSLAGSIQAEIDRQAVALALELGIVGLMNAQFAVKGEEIFLLEVNPRASRTVPFVSKATGMPLAKEATWIMIGRPLEPERLRTMPLVPYAVKETVFPFARFPGADLVLGPEMKSTGEVMGRGRTFAEAFLKSQIAASNGLRAGGAVFVGVRDEHKADIVPIARTLAGLGYRLLATPGTRSALREAGLTDIEETSLKMDAPNNLFQFLAGGNVSLVINTTRSGKRRIDPTHLRRLVLTYNIPYCTTVEAARTLVDALHAMGSEPAFSYTPLRGYGEVTTSGGQEGR
ncbi:MAG: carbamoyl-phosphate synthase large subunit, partial [SAR324 cluster bacterium]|nr:carbamoyl-phosphate synthase large subunit [SAR324 cluster bacterium]